MIEFVSEPRTPRRALFDTAAMARGEPGLPTGPTPGACMASKPPTCP